MTEYVSGDYCRFLKAPAAPGSVEHYQCDDYRDGTITNCITGEVLKQAPYDAPRGFNR